MAKSESYLDWTEFFRLYKDHRLSPYMYEIYAHANHASNGLSAKELAKLPYFWLRYMLAQGPATSNRRTSYDVCFVVDQTGPGGLSSFLPLLRHKPTGTSVLVLTRDFIAGNSEFKAAIHSMPDVDVLNMDRFFVGPLSPFQQLAEYLSVARLAKRAWSTAPQFLLRKAIYERVFLWIRNHVRLAITVVISERLLLAATVIQECRLAGLATAALQHGAFVPQHLPVYVDTYLVWGERFAKWLRDHGVRSEISLTGSPRLDDTVIHKHHKPYSEVRKPVFLFFSQPPGVSTSSAIMEKVRREAVKAVSVRGIDFRIKLHPVDRSENWADALGENWSAVRFYGPETDLAQVMSEADIACSFYSTVILEAMLFNIPVFQLVPEGAEVVDYSIGGGATRVATGEGLVAGVHKLLQDTDHMRQVIADQNRYVAEYFVNVGRAAPAIYAALARATPTNAPPAS